MSDESNTEHSSSNVNVAPWLSRAALDMSVFFLLYAPTLVSTKLVILILTFIQDRKRFAHSSIKKSEQSTNFIPLAAFDYDCRALDGPNDPLALSYENFMCVDDPSSRRCAETH